jgi:hypothetical protein
VCFLRALTRCADQERSLRRLYEQMPDLYEAYDLRHRGEARKRPLLLEVHLRAGAPVEDIARLTGCRLPVVRTYGHLFMAVPDPPPGASAVSWANACAWGLGAFLLDVCLEHFRRAAPAEGEGGRLDPSVAEHLCDALWVKVAVTLTALVAAGHDLSAVAGPVQAAVHLPGPGPAGADGWGAEVRALESILG